MSISIYLSIWTEKQDIVFFLPFELPQNIQTIVLPVQTWPASDYIPSQDASICCWSVMKENTGEEGVRNRECRHMTPDRLAGSAGSRFAVTSATGRHVGMRLAGALGSGPGLTPQQHTGLLSEANLSPLNRKRENNITMLSAKQEYDLKKNTKLLRART